MGRVPRRARERRRRAGALVAERAAAAALLPRARAPRRAAAAPLRPGRRDRDRPGRRARLRLDADAAPPGREPRRKLAAEIPAIFIAFDLLLWDGDPCTSARSKSDAPSCCAAARIWISPATTELEAATAWLDRFEATGLDGVVAKRLGLRYLPGSREGVVKVKEHKTADCVVIGVRWKQRPERLATLLLGLYRDDGEVDYVGSAAVGARNHDEIAARVLPLDESSERRFSEPNRWGNEGLEETPLRHELVAEVRYDKVQGNRFRHGTKLIRFRPDKDPSQCTWREVRPARREGDPTVESLLALQGRQRTLLRGEGGVLLGLRVVARQVAGRTYSPRRARR